MNGDDFNRNVSLGITLKRSLPFVGRRVSSFTQISTREFVVADDTGVHYLYDDVIKHTIDTRMIYIKYIPELNVIAAVTFGIPHLVFLPAQFSRLMDTFKLRLSISVVKKIHFSPSSNFLLLSGSGVEGVDLYKRFNIQINAMALEAKERFVIKNPSVGSSVFVDNKRRRFISMTTNGYQIYTFDGDKLGDDFVINDASIKTSCVLFSKRDIDQPSTDVPITSRFKRMFVTDMDGGAYLYHSSGRLMNSFTLTNRMFTFTEFINSEFILCIIGLKVVILDVKTGANYLAFTLHVHPSHIITLAPYRFGIFINGNIDIYDITIPWHFYHHDPTKSVYIGRAQGKNAYIAGRIVTLSSSGVVTLLSPEKNIILESCSFKGPIVVREILYDRGVLIHDGIKEAIGSEDRIFYILDTGYIHLFSFDENHLVYRLSLDWKMRKIFIARAFEDQRVVFFVVNEYNDIIVYDYYTLDLLTRLSFDFGDLLFCHYHYKTEQAIFIFNYRIVRFSTREMKIIDNIPIQFIPAFAAFCDNLMLTTYMDNTVQVSSITNDGIIEEYSFDVGEKIKLVAYEYHLFMLVTISNTVWIGTKEENITKIHLPFEISKICVFNKDLDILVSSEDELMVIEHQNYLWIGKELNFADDIDDIDKEVLLQDLIEKKVESLHSNSQEEGNSPIFESKNDSEDDKEPFYFEENKQEAKKEIQLNEKERDLLLKEMYGLEGEKVNKSDTDASRNNESSRETLKKAEEVSEEEEKPKEVEIETKEEEEKKEEEIKVKAPKEKEKKRKSARRKIKKKPISINEIIENNEKRSVKHKNRKNAAARESKGEIHFDLLENRVQEEKQEQPAQQVQQTQEEPPFVEEEVTPKEEETIFITKENKAKEITPTTNQNQEIEKVAKKEEPIKKKNIKDNKIDSVKQKQIKKKENKANNKIKDTKKVKDVPKGKKKQEKAPTIIKEDKKDYKKPNLSPGIITGPKGNVVQVLDYDFSQENSVSSTDSLLRSNRRNTSKSFNSNENTSDDSSIASDNISLIRNRSGSIKSFNSNENFSFTSENSSFTNDNLRNRSESLKDNSTINEDKSGYTDATDELIDVENDMLGSDAEEEKEDSILCNKSKISISEELNSLSFDNKSNKDEENTLEIENRQYSGVLFKLQSKINQYNEAFAVNASCEQLIHEPFGDEKYSSRKKLTTSRNTEHYQEGEELLSFGEDPSLMKDESSSFQGASGRRPLITPKDCRRIIKDVDMFQIRCSSPRKFRIPHITKSQQQMQEEWTPKAETAKETRKSLAFPQIRSIGSAPTYESSDYSDSDGDIDEECKYFSFEQQSSNSDLASGSFSNIPIRRYEEDSGSLIKNENSVPCFEDIRFNINGTIGTQEPQKRNTATLRRSTTEKKSNSITVKTSKRQIPPLKIPKNYGSCAFTQRQGEPYQRFTQFKKNEVKTARRARRSENIELPFLTTLPCKC